MAERDEIDRIVESIDWEPTTLPGRDRHAIVEQVMRATTSAAVLLSKWRHIEELVGREFCTLDSTIDRVRYLVEQEAAAEARAGVPYVDRVEAAAQVLHGSRHRLGWGSVCGSCRGLAAEVLAVGAR